MAGLQRGGKRVLAKLIVGAVIALSVPTPGEAFDITPPAVSFEEERRQAERNHDATLAQLGGLYDDPDVTAYVERIGQVVARHSDMPDRPFQFFLLNTPVVNAFTVGGGYVYITRGILANMNSEAELAAVLAHEVAHVTGRHTSRRQTRIQIDRLQDGLLGILTGSPAVFGLSSTISQVSQLRYSRGQEAEADRLGIETIIRAGYDPYAMAEMLSGLGREGDLASVVAGLNPGEGEPPEWLMSHPLTDRRITDTTKQAEGTGLERGIRTVNRTQHLDAINGMVFGDDPGNGVVRDGRYINTGIGLAFDIPEGFAVQNTAQAVIGIHGDDASTITTGMEWPQSRSLEDYVASIWSDVTHGTAGRIDRLEQVTVNGLPALLAFKRIESRNPIDLRTVVYRFDDEHVIHTTLLTNPGESERFDAAFDTITQSFKKLTPTEIAAVQPYRLEVVEVGAGDTVEALAGRMTLTDFAVERFQALNGIHPGDALTPGDRVKIIVGGP